MPKIPDHILDKMDSRPEFAAEEVVARNVLKRLGILKTDRDKLRFKLQDKQRGEYRVTEFDVLKTALAGSSATISNLKFRMDLITCAKLSLDDNAVEVAEQHVGGDYARGFVHVVFCRWPDDIACVSLLPAGELEFLKPPFRVEESNWPGLRWVVQGMHQFTRSLDDRLEPYNWLQDFVGEA